MTLCRHRPQRSYVEQYILDEPDLHGLIKMLDQKVAQHGEDGLSDTRLYVGALLAFATLKRMADEDGMCDYWYDFMREFDAAVRGLEEP